MRTSFGESPKRSRTAAAAVITSASAACVSSPMTSRFHWMCSRSRPRWGRSARKYGPTENHFVGRGSEPARAAYIRARVGVNSGRSA